MTIFLRKWAFYASFFCVATCALKAESILEEAAEIPPQDPSAQENLFVQDNQPSEPNFVWIKDSYASIGVNYTWVKLGPEDNSSFSGNLWGIHGAYEYRPNRFVYGKGQVLWRQGNTNGTIGNRYLVDVDAQERLGYTFNSAIDAWRLTLFSGFGWRYLSEQLKQPGLERIDFNYNQPYIPLGLLFDFRIYSWFSFGSNLVWMPQLFPTVNIVPLGGARWVVKSTYANILAEIPFVFKIEGFKSNNLLGLLQIKPFVEFREDGKSVAITPPIIIGTPPNTILVTSTSLGLPLNWYLFCGIELNFQLAF